MLGTPLPCVTVNTSLHQQSYLDIEIVLIVRGLRTLRVPQKYSDHQRFKAIQNRLVHHHLLQIKQSESTCIIRRHDVPRPTDALADLKSCLRSWVFERSSFSVGN